jgi:aarF domain-containing kinase
MPASLVRQVVQRELLQGEPLDSIFASFDDEPLGAASIAQVHAATLLDGRKVAVKVQRPNCEPKLLGDIANLKSFSSKLKNALPIDYYTVFCELERALTGELDFLQEAQSAQKVFASVSTDADGTPAAPSVRVPLPVAGLASKRVLVMDYIPGTPLNRLASVMEEKGIKPGSPESKLAGRRILNQLTEAFGRMLLGSGFIHGDPHPGNIFIMEGAKVALIDCGQVRAPSPLPSPWPRLDLP